MFKSEFIQDKHEGIVVPANNTEYLVEGIKESLRTKTIQLEDSLYGWIDFAKALVEFGKKGINRLVEVLSNDVYEVNGKTTFKKREIMMKSRFLKVLSDFK